MTNKEYLQNCSTEKLAAEIMLLLDKDYCDLCDSARGNQHCYAICPEDKDVFIEWLKAERIADNTQENNI